MGVGVGRGTLAFLPPRVGPEDAVRATRTRGPAAAPVPRAPRRIFPGRLAGVSEARSFLANWRLSLGEVWGASPRPRRPALSQHVCLVWFMSRWRCPQVAVRCPLDTTTGP